MSTPMTAPTRVAAPHHADVEFTHAVNTARASFQASLREHSLMDADALARVLDAFDTSVADISTAVLTRVGAQTRPIS